MNAIVMTGTNLLTGMPCSLTFSQKELNVLIVIFCLLLLFINRSHKPFRHKPVPMKSDLHLAHVLQLYMQLHPCQIAFVIKKKKQKPNHKPKKPTHKILQCVL